MGSTTTKGYPYPVGTDRVMDGDDAIKALAEAIDGDALFTKATTVGQSVAMNTVTQVSWNAASPNGCALTKTSASVWTVTKAGLYVVTGSVFTAAFSNTSSRNYMQLTAAGLTSRQVWTGENNTACTGIFAMVAGDQISFALLGSSEATSVTANTGYLHVSRLGRS